MIFNYYAKKKSLGVSMHSERLEPTKLILGGTRATYQAAGNAGNKGWIMLYQYHY